VELLRLPAALFGLIATLRGKLHDRGWLPFARLEVPVISVGNLSAGGTGKTPFVLMLLGELAARGRRVGVLSRGYRAPEGEGTINDEGELLARACPDLLQVQNPDRVAGGYALIERGAEVIVLDDGFQHRRLRRDLDLVLVDATRPWGLPVPDGGPRDLPPVRALLPRGLLREKPTALRRADAIVVTRSDQVDPALLEALEAELFALAPGKPLLIAEHRPVALRTAGGSRLELASLAGREVDLVSGIGNPEAFEATVVRLGAIVGEHRCFPDHHEYAPLDLEGLGEEGRRIITTAKDVVKLERGDRSPEVSVLEIELLVVRGKPVLEALLDALPPGRLRFERLGLHEGLHG
jgi:tetraacyldisaccharide 4'-kinase